MKKIIIPLAALFTMFFMSCGSSEPKQETVNEPTENKSIEESKKAAEKELESLPDESTTETVEEEVKENVESLETKVNEKVTEVVEVKIKNLTTSIPPVSVVGTPAPIKVPNLKTKLNRAPSLQVPSNTALLSKGKTVTSSDDFPIIGELELITDGEKEAGEGYYLELLDGLQWVQIDLEKSSVLEAVWVWHYHAQDRAYHDVIIQVSDDAQFSSGVTTIFNNDYDNSASLGKGSDQPYVESNFGLLVNAKKTKGRYVRLYSNNNSATEANNYIEVEVYGVD